MKVLEKGDHLIKWVILDKDKKEISTSLFGSQFVEKVMKKLILGRSYNKLK